ncbi:hypothetical protein [Fodinicola feengrottensis]|nr:hypothetical protein [Fodinicola feengrottensis]
MTSRDRVLPPWLEDLAAFGRGESRVHTLVRKLLARLRERDHSNR